MSNIGRYIFLFGRYVRGGTFILTALRKEAPVTFSLSITVFTSFLIIIVFNIYLSVKNTFLHFTADYILYNWVCDE